jgi:hypothetical protein
MAPLVKEWWSGTVRLEDVGAAYLELGQEFVKLLPEGTDTEEWETTLNVLETLLGDLEEQGVLDELDLDEFIDACDDIEDMIDDATGGIYYIGPRPDEPGAGGVWLLDDMDVVDIDDLEDEDDEGLIVDDFEDGEDTAPVPAPPSTDED